MSKTHQEQSETSNKDLINIENKINLYKHCTSLCRKLKRKHEQEILGKLEQLHHDDSKILWEILKQIKENKGELL